MRRHAQTALAAAVAGLAAAALTACGSQTKTVSVAGSPPASQTTATGSTSTTTATTPPPTKPKLTGGTSASSGTTRTAPEPAFTQHQGAPEGADAAAAVVRANGFTPNDASEYHPNQTLRVLVGTRTGSGDGYGQQAFFFVDGRYIGTDAREPSAKLRVVSQSDTSVTISYPLYRHSDPLCCPGGGHATVSFQLNNGKLAPVGSIPPATSAGGLSRN
ncbi:MAG TPA: LppP/LprE family lipoprotein [Solirubrobacteraceae bacterium]